MGQVAVECVHDYSLAREDLQLIRKLNQVEWFSNTNNSIVLARIVLYITCIMHELPFELLICTCDRRKVESNYSIDLIIAYAYIVPPTICKEVTVQ